MRISTQYNLPQLPFFLSRLLVYRHHCHPKILINQNKDIKNSTYQFALISICMSQIELSTR